MAPKTKDLPPPAFIEPGKPYEMVSDINEEQARDSQKKDLLGQQGHEGEKSSEGPGGDNPPVSAFAEPSEPSGDAPGEHSRNQLTGQQEENPQVIMTKPPKQKTKL
ncbi:hypothetical protein HYDPIDRAFT_26157 [Hydnomerulius pinastri MD-312]|nr:hypothetical protein HYDPIDRAFT_26157 [Hydnomerulius pinastri MD-312]